MYLKIVTTAATIAIGRTFYVANTVTSGVARGGQGGASAPGRRPEGGAIILTKNFFKFIY